MCSRVEGSRSRSSSKNWSSMIRGLTPSFSTSFSPRSRSMGPESERACSSGSGQKDSQKGLKISGRFDGEGLTAVTAGFTAR